MNRLAEEVVKFLRFGIFVTAGLVLLLSLLLGIFLLALKNGFMKSQFSQKACEREGGSWDAAIEICHRKAAK